jgi:hypothetical protein
MVKKSIPIICYHSSRMKKPCVGVISHMGEHICEKDVQINVTKLSSIELC